MERAATALPHTLKSAGNGTAAASAARASRNKARATAAEAGGRGIGLKVGAESKPTNRNRRAVIRHFCFLVLSALPVPASPSTHLRVWALQLPRAFCRAIIRNAPKNTMFFSTLSQLLMPPRKRAATPPPAPPAKKVVRGVGAGRRATGDRTTRAAAAAVADAPPPRAPRRVTKRGPVAAPDADKGECGVLCVW